MAERSVYKSELHENIFDPKSLLIISSWHTPADLEESVYRQELTNYFECVKEHQPKCVLIDAVDANYAITVETQKWIVDTFFPIYKEIGLKKMGILLPEEIISNLSIEQTMEENKDPNMMQTRYFNEKKEALEWLSK